MSAVGIAFGHCSFSVAIGGRGVVENPFGNRTTPAAVCRNEDEDASSTSSAFVVGEAAASASPSLHLPQSDPEFWLQCARYAVDGIARSYAQDIKTLVICARPAIQDVVRQACCAVLRRSSPSPSPLLPPSSSSSSSSGKSKGNKNAARQPSGSKAASTSSSTSTSPAVDIVVIDDSVASVFAYDLGSASPAASRKIATLDLADSEARWNLFEIRHGGLLAVSPSAPQEIVIPIPSFTSKIVEFLAAEAKKKLKIDPSTSARAMAKLAAAAGRVKHVLSVSAHASVEIDSLIDGMDFVYPLSRARFESIVDDVLAAATDCVLNSPQHEILLVGGSSKIPRLFSFLKSSQVLAAVAPDEVCALGCAKIAADRLGMLSDHDVLKACSGGRVQSQIVSRPLGIKIGDDAFVVVPAPALAPVSRRCLVSLENVPFGVAAVELVVFVDGQNGGSGAAIQSSSPPVVVLGSAPFPASADASDSSRPTGDLSVELCVLGTEGVSLRLIDQQTGHLSSLDWKPSAALRL